MFLFPPQLFCLAEQAALPEGTDAEALATFVLAVMEGGVMLSRSHRDVKPFDQAVAELRTYFNRLLKTPKKNRKKTGGRS